MRRANERRPVPTGARRKVEKGVGRRRAGREKAGAEQTREARVVEISRRSARDKCRVEIGLVLQRLLGKHLPITAPNLNGVQT
jgi:hypothetical protein